MMPKVKMNFAGFFKFFKLSVSLAAYTAMGVLVLAGVLNIYAQKRKPPVTTVNKEKEFVIAEPIHWLGAPCIPQDSDHSSVLQMDENSRLSLTTQKNGSSEVLFSALPISSLSKVLSSTDKNSVITFQAAPVLNFGLVAKTLFDIRQAADACVNIEASTRTEDQYVYLLPEPRPTNEAVFPNPLTLVVNLDKNLKLSLNNEPSGSLADTARLGNFLKKIFKEREDNGVFNEATNEVEKTVFVKASPAVKFGDVIKVVDALKEAGAFPIGLQIDDL